MPAPSAPSRSRIERVRVKLPRQFDDTSKKHMEALQALIAKEHGEGFEIESIDLAESVASATRQVQVMQVVQETAAGRDVQQITLPRSTKPSDGDKVAARLEDAHPGYTLTRFEPFLYQATMEKMTPAAIRCRGAIAVALSVKPWEIQVTDTVSGGFTFTLPRTYVPSKHDDKLHEIAEAVVGREGWFATVNAQELHGEIVPSSPPTFPPLLPYPFARAVPPFDAASGDWARIPLGEKLPAPGQQRGEMLVTDFIANPMMQISGVTGGGKGVLLTALASGALARGWELGLVDAVKGGVDFMTSIVPHVKPGFFAENLEQACAVVAMAYDEGQRRKKLIKAEGVQKFTQLSNPPRPLMIIVDEATSLLLTSAIPKGIDKTSSIAIEIGNRNLLMATTLEWMGKIARELRFVGVSLVLSTQVASATVGIPTELRANLGAKFLMGASPTPGNRRLALAAPDAVPEVPRNIASDEAGAARGVGVFEREGSAPGVFKAYFSPPETFGQWLAAKGVPTTSQPNPTASQIDRWTPALQEEEFDDAPRGKSRFDEGGFGHERPRDEPRLRGAAAAAHASKLIADGAA